MDYIYKPTLKNKIYNVTSGTNVDLCCYKINNTGRMPFLQYLLENVNETLDFHTVPLNLDDTNNLETSTRNILTIASNFLFKVTGVEQHIFSYIGYKKYNGCIYLFIDISSCDLKKCHGVHFCLIDEMVNVKHVYNKPIALMVTNFVRDNMSLFTVLDTNNKAWEFPSAVYVGRDQANLNFTYTFGNRKSHDNTMLGPHYYFTDFENASKHYGAVRFAIFTGNNLVKLNFPNDEIDESLLKQQKLDNKYELMTQRITDYDGKWATDYDSVYLGHIELDDGQMLRNTPIIVVKVYDQQIPLDYQINL